MFLSTDTSARSTGRCGAVSVDHEDPTRVRRMHVGPDGIDERPPFRFAGVLAVAGTDDRRRKLEVVTQRLGVRCIVMRNGVRLIRAGRDIGAGMVVVDDSITDLSVGTVARTLRRTPVVWVTPRAVEPDELAQLGVAAAIVGAPTLATLAIAFKLLADGTHGFVIDRQGVVMRPGRDLQATKRSLATTQPPTVPARRADP